MQFIWQQIPQYLYAAEIYSLRITNHFLNSCIPIDIVYTTADKIITKQLGTNLEYFGYFILQRRFLLKCLTGIIMPIKCDMHERSVPKDSNKVLPYPLNLHFLLHDIKHPSLDFLKIIFFKGKIYVFNWNSIIERRATIENLENPRGYFCSRSCLQDMSEELVIFRVLNFSIQINQFYRCSNCSLGKSESYCCDFMQQENFNFTRPGKYKQNWDLLFDDDSEKEMDDDYDKYDDIECHSERLSKRQALKRRIFEQKKKVTN